MQRWHLAGQVLLSFLKLSVNKAKAMFSLSPSYFTHQHSCHIQCSEQEGKAGNSPCQTPIVACSLRIGIVYAMVNCTVWFIQNCRLVRKKYGHKQHFYFCPVIPWSLTVWSPIGHTLTEVIL